MNRSAIVIIIASSCAGSPSLLKGCKSLSTPSVRDIGVVVKVSSELPRIRRANRDDIFTAIRTPSQVICTQPITINGVPAVKNRLITAENTMMSMTGLSPLSMYPKGTFERLTISISNNEHRIIPQKWLALKSNVTNQMVPRSLIRGSR